MLRTEVACYLETTFSEVAKASFQHLERLIAQQQVFNAPITHSGCELTLTHQTIAPKTPFRF